MKTIILLSFISGLLVVPHADFWWDKMNQNEIIHIHQPNEVSEDDFTHNINPIPIQEYPDWFVEFIKEKEGFRSKPYYCCGGVRTIGYGFTDKSILNRFPSMTQEQAESILINEVLPQYRNKVRSIVSVPLTERQELALTSFCMNLGATNLQRLVNGSQRLNGGNYDSIRNILPKYRKAGGEVREGLVKRRAFEVELFYSDGILASL